MKFKDLALCDTIAFPDDILLCFQGKDPSQTFSQAQEILNFASDWSKSFKLDFNPDKTKVMCVEKRNGVYDAFQLFLDGTPLTVVKHMKYLGVFLESKFSWKRHLTYVSEKCDNLQRGLSRVARNTYGIKYNVHSLIYKQGIEPFILYGSRVWGMTLKKKINYKYLRRIQRRILLRVICGYRTVSYDSVYAISGFPPIDIAILHNIELKNNISVSISSDYDCDLPSSVLPHPSERNAINIIQFSNKTTDDFPIICYTDGSKIDGKVGLAFVVFRDGYEIEHHQFRIRDQCTVFIAELLCLNFAIKWITEQTDAVSDYLICTDSLSSLDTLKCISSSNNIIVEIQRQLKDLKNNNISVAFAFVRGHTGIAGNERADFLAKTSTKRDIDVIVNTPNSFHKKVMYKSMVESWNHEYVSSTKGNLTKRFFPSIDMRLSCHHFYTNYKITQFLTGHGNFKSYLSRFKLGPEIPCDCGVGGEENVEHVLFLCSKFASERNTFRLALKDVNIDWPPNLHQLIANKCAFESFCKFIAFVCNSS